MNNKGFSLIEIILTMIIISILALISFNSCQKSMAKDLLQKDANNLYLFLRTTRSLVFRYDEPVKVTFNNNMCKITIPNTKISTKTFNLSKNINFGIAKNGPVDAPEGMLWDSSGRTSLWRDSCLIKTDAMGSTDTGSIYLKHDKLPKITYCIGTQKNNLSIILFMWTGSEWIKL